MRTLTISLLVVVLTGPCLGAGFRVLDAGQKAVIVYDRYAKDEGVRAYQDLAAYLEKSTGQEFVVVSEREFQPDGRLPIYVGHCRPVQRAIRADLRRLDRDAYMVVVEEDQVMLAGPRPWSTYWAVCQFLEDYVGVRWLIPGPLGEDVPRHDRIVVPGGKHTYSPSILSRLWSGAHYGGVWSLRQRIHGRYAFHHNLLNIFPTEKYFDQHPEYFPIHGDERYRPGKDDHSWQPCMTDPGTVQVAADAAREAFEKNPDVESFSYGINDGGGWCECPDCKANDRPMPAWHDFSGDKSYLYYSWLNRVAENLEQDHPDKMLGCLAYSSCILPPPGLKLHRNIIPYFTSNRADYWDPKFRGQDERLLRRWSRSTSQMGIYDYAYGMGFAVPRIFNHLFQGAIQFAVAHEVRGFYAEVYPNWGLDGHKLYVMSRLLWNPKVNVDALTDEWNERMFREAAEPMNKHFARCERAWREEQKGTGHWAYRLASDPAQFEIFPLRILEECTGYLDEAAGLAKDDVVKERIHFFRKTWDVTLLLAGNYHASGNVQALIEEGADIQEIAAAMREAADRTTVADIDAYVKEKVGDDRIAYHDTQRWFSRLKAGAVTNAKRWCAAHLANGEIERARQAGPVDAAAVRKAIDARATESFGTGGSDQYRRAADQVRGMALKVATVVRARTAPKIDGVLDDEVWKRADVLSDFIKWGESAPSAHATRVRLVHDGADLFVAIESEQDTSSLRAEAAPRDGNTWHDDSVEMFINPEMTEAPYIQFIINAAGAFFDQWSRTGTESYAERLAHNFDCDWAATVEKGRWTAEMRLPLKEFGCDPEDHPLLRVDLVRNVQGDDPEISAWFPSIGAHADPLSRGWIVFE